jgi:hypothetical protein
MKKGDKTLECLGVVCLPVVQNPSSRKIVERITTHVEFYHIQTLFPAKTVIIFTRFNPN